MPPETRAGTEGQNIRREPCEPAADSEALWELLVSEPRRRESRSIGGEGLLSLCYDETSVRRSGSVKLYRLVSSFVSRFFIENVLKLTKPQSLEPD